MPMRRKGICSILDRDAVMMYVGIIRSLCVCDGVVVGGRGNREKCRGLGGVKMAGNWHGVLELECARTRGRRNDLQVIR